MEKKPQPPPPGWNPYNNSGGAGNGSRAPSKPPPGPPGPPKPPPPPPPPAVRKRPHSFEDSSKTTHLPSPGTDNGSVPSPDAKNGANEPVQNMDPKSENRATNSAHTDGSKRKKAKIDKKRRFKSKWRKPQHLRDIMSSHTDMSKRQANSDKIAYLGALKYLPHAIFKLLENMPQPWEAERQVKVLYHVTGAVTFVNEQPLVAEPSYRAQWGETWDAMRQEKHDRSSFRRMRLPPMDDDEPPLSWQDHFSDLDLPNAIPLKHLCSVGPGKTWHLGVQDRAQCLKEAKNILEVGQGSSEYAFDKDSLVNAKSLNLTVQHGPKFQPLFKGTDFEDADEFDDATRIIFRHPVRTEARVMFPELFNPQPKAVRLPPYQQPLPVKLKAGGANTAKTWFRDQTLTPLPTKRTTTNGNAKKLGFTPFLSDVPLESPLVKDGIELFNSPFPFNQHEGRKRRAEDINFLTSQISRRPHRGMVSKVRLSRQRLLKSMIKRSLRRNGHGSETTKANLLASLKSTKFFLETSVDWLEAGLQLCRQGHSILQLLIHKKGLHFLHLDYNFNLKPTKTLTTKERKRSRFGNSFHLVRELLKAIKLVVDCHAQYRLGNVDAYELADGLHYIFNHMGQLTGIYRYKYKVMRQIRACKDLKHVIYAKFNADGVGKGPGCGFWQPSWCVWLAWLRGTIPLLERWLGNLLARQFEGRVYKGIAKTITKQRVDSQYDLELRDAVLNEILDMIPEGIRQSKTRTVLSHLTEAWRCWKANIPWQVPGMPPPVASIIERYVRSKADAYVRGTHINRDRIRRGATVDKSVARKNLGRLTRLWVKDQQTAQESYIKDGPYLDPSEAITVYTTAAHWLESQEFTSIGFPEVGYKNDTKLLVLALENLRDGFASTTSRLNQTQREELTLIENAFETPHEALTRIKRTLLTQRIFKDLTVELNDFGSTLSPVYSVDPLEKITDAYLDQYLWYEADIRGLFPSWIKPSDDEVPPILVHKWCTGISNLTGVWDCNEGQASVHVQFTLEKFVERVDFTLLNKLLRLIVDSNIADYITAKMNAVVSYKDMRFVNQVGIIRGFQFSGFVVQFYGLCLDLLILGLTRANDLVNSCSRFAKWESGSAEISHPIRLYCRYFDQCFLLVRLNGADAQDLIDDYEVTDNEPYPTQKCWPRDWRMRLIRRDTIIGRTLFSELQGRIPQSLATISWSHSNVSVYSMDNPALTFSMAGFAVRLIARSRAKEDGDGSGHESCWNIIDEGSQERTALAFLKVGDQEGIERFKNRIRQILMSSGATTFAKIVKRWNTALTALVTYYREAIVATPELLDTLVKCEQRIQNKVKMGLNSKMPTRFPPCVFYSPEELGGLGMLSASHIMIPVSDLRWSKQGADGQISHFKSGMQDIDGSLIPNLFRYVTPWESELSDSQRVWSDYAQLKIQATHENRRIGLEDLEDSWNRGLPRINTLFQKDRQTLALDRGYRARNEYKVYSNAKYNPFWWTNQRHDGRLWNFNAYRADMIQALGGIETILEHSLFKGTGFDSWEGLFWDRGGGLEDQLQQFRKLTNAQRTGLSQIPNRRFTLWWSPTINRANVYVGFLVQLDLTGIFLHGKIPTLKISFIQIFRAHLWQKIHESLVVDMCQVIDRDTDTLQIESVVKERIHPRKSYRMNASSADILLKSTYKWPVSKPSLLNSPSQGDKMDFATADEFWIDIQLRYGDYDSHDISRYTRAKFLDYTSDGVSLYPSPTGVLICVDLAYNVYDAYGNWFPGLKPLVRNAMAKIMKVNPALFVLRERIRKALQLYQAQPTQPRLSSSNYMDLFGGEESCFFVDDSIVYRVATHKTVEGNVTAKPINGAAVIVNPRTGHLYLKVLHAATTWAGQKRRVALSKWKTAEEVGSLLRSLPNEELPKQLIITSKGLMDPLEVHMLDHPNIAVRTSELHLPFKALISLSTINELINDATESKMVLLNLYDNWLESLQPTTAFSRLMLLLRGLSIAPEKVRLILWPPSTTSDLKKRDTFWPTLSHNEWIAVENELSDIIIGDYGRKNGINVQALTQLEIRDIILGQPIKTPSQERLDAVVEAIEAAAPRTDQSSNDSNSVSAVKTRTHNVHGEEMVVVTTSNYEQQVFESRTTWRQRALACAGLHMRSKNLYLEQTKSLVESRVTYVLPKNIVQLLVLISDVRSQVGALLYGSPATDNPMVMEISAMAIVPQLGTTTNISMAPDPSNGQVDSDLVLLGVMHTQIQDRLTISPADLAFFSQRGWISGLLAISLIYTAGSVTINPLIPTDEGIAWAATNRDLLSAEPEGYDSSIFATQAQMILSDKLKGFVYSPQDQVWNHSFLGALWNPKAEPYMRIARPIPYYHELHRPIHFLAFSEMNENWTEVDDPLS